MFIQKDNACVHAKNTGFTTNSSCFKPLMRSHQPLRCDMAVEVLCNIRSLGPTARHWCRWDLSAKLCITPIFFGWHWLMDVNGLWVSVLYSMNLLCFFQKTHLFYKAPASCLAVKNRQKSTGDSPWGAWPWPPGPSGGQLAQRALTKNFMVGGLEHGFYDFPYIGNNHPNWLSYFSEG